MIKITENKSGIYKITSPTGKVYVGQSMDINSRWNRYKKHLCNMQPILHRSFVKYGVNNHSFEVLEYCDVNLLNDKERYYQDKYNCVSKNGLNCRLTKSKDRVGNFSSESKLNMSISAKKRKLTDDEINRRTKYLVEFNKTMKGVPKTQEIKDKISKTLTGRKLYNQRGFDHYRGVIVLNTETGIYYGSIAECAKSCHYSRWHLCAKLRERNRLINNTKFIIV